MSRKVHEINGRLSEDDESVFKRVKYDDEGKKIKGKVVLMKKNILDLNDVGASIFDRFDEIRGHKVFLQLVSAVNAEPAGNKCRGKLGKPAALENWITKITPLTADYVTFGVTFEWDEEVGVPGAFVVKNHHHNEFYLKTLTLEDVPGHGSIHFLCNSWVYPFECYKRDRVFFSNQTYLPSETPEVLCLYREDELESLRGSGTGKLEEWDRVYDYDVYNDLGDPDKGEEYKRRILGGSSEFPYPRRVRTGRPPATKDPLSESTLSVLNKINVYVPRDEKFNQIKMSDFLAYALKAILHFIVPEFEDLFDETPHEFDSFEDILKLYDDGFKVNGSFEEKIKAHLPMELLKELFRSDGARLYKFTMPQIIENDKTAWRTDEEFAREMLAGLNPLVIRRLQEFPPASKLDRERYGNQDSRITKVHIESNLDGKSVDEVMKGNRLFILDHHDYLMPCLTRINSTGAKTYASRTLLFLKDDGTLKPLAIELSRPLEDEDQFRTVSQVYTPAEDGVEGTIWQLAKAYVAVNDSGHHQLISHWLRTHCSIEPFIIATNRQLSVLHPIHKLLHPHFRDTVHVNALARQILINADGILERTNSPGKFALEMTAEIYKDWVFPEQALPADLIKRGMAVEDSNSPHGLQLLIEDYPFAADGLQIWSAIKTWVKDYCEFYYKDDNMVKEDTELQSWWKEVREKGHGDKKDEPWWPQMQSREELISSCTIIIWVASALHAAVNFGQYPYGGYLPNRPSMSRRFMPEPNSPEYDELKTDPDKAFLKTITPQLQTIIGISLIEQLSIHSSDEVYLGDREEGWTTDDKPLKALEKFNQKLREIEEKITHMNKDSNMKNRFGPVKMPYTLLYRTSEKGLTGRGVPNSITI